MRFLYTLFAMATAGWTLNAWALDPPSLKTMENYTRLIIPMDNGAGFHVLSQDENGVNLAVEHTSTNHLKELAGLVDSRVTGIAMQSTGLEGAKLRLAFRNSGTESFAYFQPNPPAVVIDVWTKTSPAVSVNAKATAPKKAKKGRRLASTSPPPPPKKQVETVPPLDADHDIFARFVLLPPDFQFRVGRLAMPPRLEIEKMWSFTQPKAGKGNGAGEFLFAQRLFADGKFGLCIRALEIANRDFPQSPYSAEMHLLMAFAYKRLGETTNTDALVSKADDILRVLGARVDEQGHFLPFHQEIRIYFANKAYVKKQWLEAIDQFEALSAGMSQTDGEYPYLQMILAGLYATAEQGKRAERVYRFLEEKYAKQKVGREAAYRKTTLLAAVGNYDRLIEDGESAIHDFPEYQDRRPEVFFNLGEAYFWKHRYSESAKAFRRFLTLAPANTHGSEAHVRLGEIAEITKHDFHEAEQEYLSAKNEFPFSAGDQVATLRLARLALPTETALDFQIHSLREISEAAEADTATKQIAKLLLVKYLLKQKSVTAAVATAREGMASNPEGVVSQLFQRAYIESLFQQLHEANVNQKYPEALALYQDQKSWIEQYGPDYMREVAETYRGLGLYDTSNRAFQQYLAARVVGRGRVLAGETAGDHAIHLQSARNALAQGHYAEALTDLGNDESDLTALWIKASAQFGLKEWLAADRTAEKGVAMVAKLKGSSTGGPDQERMLEAFGDILVEHGNREKDYAYLLENADRVRALLTKKVERFDYSRANALWYLGRHQEAIPAYAAALSDFPKSDYAERAKYNMGMSYVALGKRDEAVKVLTDLGDKSQTVWGKSAKQELELMNWEKKYSSVLKSLPPTGLGIVN